MRAHAIAEFIWGDWETLDKRSRSYMYAWIRRECPKAHIGEMDERELKFTCKRMMAYAKRIKVPITEEEITKRIKRRKQIIGKIDDVHVQEVEILTDNLEITL